jgi:cysteinyl-tRNA synthetase
VFEDLLRRTLRLAGWNVVQVMNLTDVDDKIIKRAQQQQKTIGEVTDPIEKIFHDDRKFLRIEDAEHYPRATAFIPQMISLVERLMANGNAYVAQDHVLFDVGSMPDYGRLANRSLTEMEAGARVDVAPYKKGPMDFVLWKPSKPGEPAWPSPAGIAAPGRPGWHIECSAMADRWLWEEPKLKGLLSEAGLKQPHVFDIHGGGIDLVFPHHENEIAQSRCGHGTAAMANYWLHNGFLQVEGEKMSKSLGNFVTIRELLETDKFGGRRWPGEVLRLAMLMTHYRQPINWSVERLREADAVVARMNEITGALPASALLDNPSDEVLRLLSDDLNTPAAVAHIQKACSKNTHTDQEAASILADMVAMGLAPAFEQYRAAIDATASAMRSLSSHQSPVAEMLRTFFRLGTIGRTKRGLLALAGDWKTKFDSVSKFAAPGILFVDVERALAAIEPDQLNRNISDRLAARKAKDFKEADRIRDELSAMGIQLKDAKDPATGEIVTTWDVKR